MCATQAAYLATGKYSMRRGTRGEGRGTRGNQAPSPSLAPRPSPLTPRPSSPIPPCEPAAKLGGRTVTVPDPDNGPVADQGVGGDTAAVVVPGTASSLVHVEGSDANSPVGEFVRHFGVVQGALEHAAR